MNEDFCYTEGVDIDMCDFKYSTEEIKKSVLKIQACQMKKIEDDLLRKFTEPFYMRDFKWPTEAETRVSSWRAMTNYGISFRDPRRCVAMRCVDDTPKTTPKTIPNKPLRIFLLGLFIVLFLLIWN
jgi:hypothetical protein